MSAFDDLRIAAAKAEALAHAAETMYDGMVWPSGVDRQDIERLAHLIGAAAEAAAATVTAVDRFNSEVCDAMPVLPGAAPADWGDK